MRHSLRVDADYIAVNSIGPIYRIKTEREPGRGEGTIENVKTV